MAATNKRPNDARTRLQGTDKYQGMNWCRQDFRLAVYLRDGLACVWCGEGVEQGAKLALDHCTPHSKGGTNKDGNLVTVCCRCNSRRGNRSIAKFAEAAAAYSNHGLTAASILGDIRRQTSRKLAPYRVQAKALIASRGSAAKALQTFTKQD